MSSPATTTRSNRGFELSPRVRPSKIVMRKPALALHPCTATGIADRRRAYPTLTDAGAATSLADTRHFARFAAFARRRRHAAANRAYEYSMSGWHRRIC